MTPTLFPNKVAYFKFFYENQEGLRVKHKPEFPSARGVRLDNIQAFPHVDYPNETLLERARRLDILDAWTPVCVVQMCNSHSITYCGAEAIKMKSLLWKQLKS